MLSEQWSRMERYHLVVIFRRPFLRRSLLFCPSVPIFFSSSCVCLCWCTAVFVRVVVVRFSAWMGPQFICDSCRWFGLLVLKQKVLSYIWLSVSHQRPSKNRSKHQTKTKKNKAKKTKPKNKKIIIKPQQSHWKLVPILCVLFDVSWL